MLDLTSEEKNVAQFFCVLLGMDEENMAGNEEKSCCCWVALSCPTLCNPMDCSTSGSSVFHYLLESAQIHFEPVMLSNHLILCHPLFLLPSILPGIRVFFNKWALHIMWPTYWSSSFSISPANEYSGFISFRIDWFDLLAVQGTLEGFF